MKAGIIRISSNVLRELLKLPKDSKIIKLGQLETMVFELCNSGEPTLQIMFESSELKHEVEKGVVVPIYNAYFEKKENGEISEMKFS